MALLFDQQVETRPIDLAERLARIASPFDFDPTPQGIEAEEISFDPVERITDDEQASRTIGGEPISPLTTLTNPMLDRTTNTRKEARIASGTVDETTPGSSANFQAFEQATLPPAKTKRWYQQSNGEIPIEKMVKVQNVYLRPEAARDFKAMNRAMKRDIGKTFRVTDGYRTLEIQKCLDGSGPCPPGYHPKPGLAAPAGTSNHGWGEAVDGDVSDPEVLAWLRRRGAEFGFHELTDPVEPWHWDWRPDGTYKPTARPRNRAPKRAEPRRRSPQPSRPRTLEVGEIIAPRSSLVAPAFAFALVQDEIFGGGNIRRRNSTSDVGMLEREQSADTSTREGIIALAKKMAAAYGWTGRQWQAVRWIVEGRGDVPGESNWDPNAVNEESGAAGIPQRLPSAHPWGSDEERQKWMNSVRAQLKWFYAYIDQRYGDPLTAWRHRKTTPTHWY